MVRIIGIDKVYLFSTTLDMRKGIKGLSSIISELYEDEDKEKTKAFVFLSSSKKMMKVIILEEDEAWIIQRRLPKGVERRILEQKNNSTFVLSKKDLNDIFKEIIKAKKSNKK